MNSEQIKYIAEDLEYLRDGWSPDINEPDIRRGSAVLRRLLVEFAYTQAWKAAGFEKQPKVIAVDLDSILGCVDDSDIICSLAWGAEFRGLYMSTPCVNRGSFALGSASPPMRKKGFPGEREFYLNEFVESTSGLASGTKVNRREVIKYVANVKGGVHLSSKRRTDEKALIKKLEKFEQKISAHTTDGILVEIVSIAQAIGMSEDAHQLIEYANRI
ncbi:hypothetical protein [Pleionea sediminis]|uniref:hypothetical protein n=1 Tax=Pleionea sediminis TaxID=2569479 RepID=UPI00118687D9|nr:hypothetical protein [Pleionea sediminis]